MQGVLPLAYVHLPCVIAVCLSLAACLENLSAPAIGCKSRSLLQMLVQFPTMINFASAEARGGWYQP